MTKAYASITINLPVSTCYEFVKNVYHDPKFVSAYRSLYSGMNYSGRVVDSSENQRMVIHEPAMDGLTGMRMSGWTITYDFHELDSETTKIELMIEYGLLLGIMGLSTMHIQAKNEVLGRILALMALEQGNALNSNRE